MSGHRPANKWVRPRAPRLLLLLLCARGALGQTTPPSNAAIGALDRLISVSIKSAPLPEALLVLRRQHDVPLAWSGDVVPAERRVSVHLPSASVRSVLDALLKDSGLRTVLTKQGTIVIVAGEAPISVSTESGLEPDDRSAPVQRALRGTGIQQLDNVVVMGSSVNGPEREQPTAVRVVSAQRVGELVQPRISDLVRTEFPGLVLWDRGPTGPPASFAAVRGVASFTTRAIKTYVDGVEIASPELFTLVDARGVESLEMIRGPQGAALYGPDALNGIVQIRTRHGRIGAPSWRTRASAGAGSYERQDLRAVQPLYDVNGGISGSSSKTAFDASAAFATVGRDSASRQMRSWNGQIGATALWGPVLLEASARAAQYDYAASRLAAVPTVPTIPQQVAEQAFALSATYQATASWRQKLVIGRHAIEGDREPFRSPLLPPRLPVGASYESASRFSARYASNWELAPWLEIGGGAEYSSQHIDREVIRAVATTNLSPFLADALRSTGAFAQGRVRLGPHLVISGGLRGEQLSSVGPRQGASWATTFGASWNREFDRATVRVRGAWGRGIRPPESGMRLGRATSVIRQVANPDLAAERQHGVEGGIDLFLRNGLFFRFTGYTQTATDLLQQVSVRSVTVTPEAYQFQNVGVVSNDGVEFEGGAKTGRITSGASLHFPRSVVRSLSPRYTGELRPGDRMIEVPEAAGAAYVRYSSSRVAPRWTAEVGASLLGAWTGYDWLLLARIERGQATRRDLVRDYWLRYPGVVRPYLAATVRVAGAYRAYVRIDNPGNDAALIRDNATSPLGRAAMFGLERGR